MAMELSVECWLVALLTQLQLYYLYLCMGMGAGEVVGRAAVGRSGHLACPLGRRVRRSVGGVSTVDGRTDR